MAVYVDALLTYTAGVYRGRAAAQARRTGSRHGHRWCHLLADSLAELHAFAEQLGLKKDWYRRGHYDLVPPRRARALELGAIEVDRATAVRLWKQLMG